jgi:spore germination protein YaaH
MNGPSEIGESDPSAPQAPKPDPGLTEIPVIDRIPRNTTGKKKSHKPPRPTRETPRTQLLLPQSRTAWAKIAGMVAGVVLVVAAALAGLRLISDNGCNEFTAENQTVAAGPLKINVLPGDLVGSFGVKTSIVPLAEFGPSATAGEAQAAAAVIPQTLSPQSDFVVVRTCSVNPKLITLRMAVPAEVASLGSLDLYGWNAQSKAWNWIGGEVNEADREIIGYTNEMPSAIMLMKTAATQPVLGLDVPPATPQMIEQLKAFSSMAGELSSSGIYIADMGNLAGDRSKLLPSGTNGTKVIPAVRNWGENGEVNRTMVRNLLGNEKDRANHVANLVGLVDAAGYDGLEVDYRGIDESQQQAFTGFIDALSKRLQEKGKSLVVTVPAPVLDANNAFGTPGYDLRRLSRLATQIKLDLTTNPAMLMSSQLDKGIDWISGQVNRYKLQLIVPATSIQQDANNRTRLIGMEEALAGLGQLQAIPDLAQPGSSVQLKWQGDGNPVDVTYDPETKAYCYSYIDDRGIKQTVWLSTAASLHHVLERLSQHNLRGVTLRGLMRAGNDDGVQQVVEGYLQGRLADVTLPDPQVKVAFGQGTPFSLPMNDEAMVVQAPGGEGAYDLRAQFASARTIDLGATQVKVSKDAPAPVGGASALNPTDALSGTVEQSATLAAVPTPGVVAGVSAERFELGGHVNDLSHITQMKGAGMSWARTEVADLNLPADFIKEAKAKGMKVLVTAVGDRTRVMDEAYRAEWTQHLGKLAAAGVDAIEVWSGPNYEADWPTGNISGASYTALLKQAYAAIKQANPNTLVISGGMAQTGGAYSGGCDEQGCDELAFLGQMAAAGAKDAMDCIGIHYTNGVEAPASVGGGHYSWYFTPLWNAYYGAFNGAKPVCFTAMGYVTADGFADGMPANYSFAAGTTLQNHAAWLAEAAKLAKASEKVRLAIVWNVDSTLWRGGDEGDPQAGYAMIRPDGTCPACETLSGVMASE